VDTRLAAFDLLRARGEATRPELGAALGLSPGAVSNLAGGFLKEGVVEEAGFRDSAGGRRAAVLRLAGGYARALTLEVTRREVRGAVVDLAGRVLARAAGEADATSPDALVASVLAVARDLARAPEARGARGMGVAVGGLVDREAGVVRRFPLLETWRDVPLGAMLQEALGYETRLANEIQVAAQGELRFGVARGLANAAYLHIGRGIGVGLVLGGRVASGAHGTAGELGHVRAGAGEELCHCGAAGCLEAECAPAAVVKAARRALGEGVSSTLAAGEAGALTFEDVVHAASEGDRLATNLLERMGARLGEAVAGLVNVFDPEAVILGGRLASGTLLESLRRAFDARVLPALRGLVTFREAALGPDASLLGAADLVFDLLFAGGRGSGR